MTNPNELSAEEYADQVLESFDPEWHGSEDQIAFVRDEVIAYIARSFRNIAVGTDHVNRESVETMVRARLAARG